MCDTGSVLLTLVIYFSTFVWTLLKGFVGDGFSCSDLNECETGDHECDKDAKCTNTVGSFTCECEQGKRGIFCGKYTNCVILP